MASSKKRISVEFEDPSCRGILAWPDARREKRASASRWLFRGLYSSLFIAPSRSVNYFHRSPHEGTGSRTLWKLSGEMWNFRETRQRTRASRKPGFKILQLRVGAC